MIWAYQPLLPGASPTQEAAAEFVPSRSVALLMAVVAAWTPLDPSPTLARKLNPSQLNVLYDNPQFDQRRKVENTAVVVSSWPRGWDLPLVGPKLVFPAAAAQVDNPPVRSNAKEQLAAGGRWPSGWDLPIVGPKLVPGSVDQPARTSSIRQAVAFSQWPSGWDLPILPPKITPPSNDDPPVVSNAKHQHAAGGEWPQGWRLPIVGPKLVQPGPDSPPVKSNNIRQLAAGGEWPSGWSLPLVGPKLVQPAPPAAVNDPPFDMRGRVNAFLSVYAWFPAPNQPTPLVKGKINPTALNVLYNPPPFSHRGRTVQAATAIASWPIGWTLPVLKPPVIRDEPPTVVGQVNDYIVTFGRRRGRR